MPNLETKFDKILQLLVASRIDFVVIGGFAAMIHGANRATFDVDIVYSRSKENIKRLANALIPVQPYLRNVPPGLPFRWDEQTLAAGLNFTLQTTLGYLDLLGEVTGGGSYDDLLPFTEDVRFYGVNCRCVTLEKLILLKRAAGRPKDLEPIAELQALLREKKGKPPIAGGKY